jgi:signal transduction histidine kinase
MSSGILDRIRRTWGVRTLGLRLVLGYAVLYIVSTALLAVLAYVLFTRYMREPDRVFMQEQAYELAAAYEEGGVDGLRRELGTTSPDERREELLVRLADTRGETVLLYNPDNWTLTEVALLEQRPPPDDESLVALGPAEDEDALEAFTVRLGDDRILQVGMDADLRADAMKSMQEAFLAIAFPVLILGLLVGIFMAYRALEPFRRLGETLHEVIDTGDVKTRVPVEDARGEFADLIHLFNRMLDRIEALVQRMRETVDNVAHDLLTPMTRLRGTAELAVQENRDAEGYRDALIENIEASALVVTMLETIMDVAEAESGTMPLQLTTLQATELIDDVVELYRLVAEEKGLIIETNVPPDLQIMVDRGRMRQVLANLIDNAIKYTPYGGSIAVVAEAGDGEVIIKVRDTGIGIAPEERHRVWDRLYRGDQSRSKRGLGLGLSVVKAIVEAHGGRAEVGLLTIQGSELIVSVPQARIRESGRIDGESTVEQLTTS